MNYRVAGHIMGMADAATVEAVARVSGFLPFAVEDDEVAEFSFRAYTVQVDEEPFPVFDKRLYTFHYEEVESCFGTVADGYLLELMPDDEEALQLWVRPSRHECLWRGNPSARLMRFAVWTGFGALTAGKETVALHSSCIVCNGRAFLFLGESGTGKSTHTRLWRQHILGSFLLNDDSPIVRCEADGIYVYGSPWSGKTPCYRAERYPLGGCVRLSQAPCNDMKRLGVLQAFAALHPSAPPAFAYDATLYDGISVTLSILLERTPVYHLRCLPDKEAAELAHSLL